jgi:uncharacterized membrane protein YdjX (TVP38/TMEM64 family)
MSSTRVWTRRALLLLVFLVILGARLSGVGAELELARLQARSDSLQHAAESSPLTAAVIFTALYALGSALALPGLAALTLVGGFLFGPWLATLYVNLGATTGATLAFLGSRYLFRDLAETRFGAKLQLIQHGFQRNAASYLLTLRLIPLVPFFLLNVVSGLTHIPLRTYVLITSVGILPGSFVYAFAGRQLGSIRSLSDVASPGVVAAFVMLGLLALAPILWSRLTPFTKTSRERKSCPTVNGPDAHAALDRDSVAQDPVED